MKLFKSCKYNSLKPTIFQKHRNDLAIMTSNGLNETHRERHAQLLSGKGKRFVQKINRSRRVITRSRPVATINYYIVVGFYKIRYRRSKKKKMKPLSHLSEGSVETEITPS